MFRLVALPQEARIISLYLGPGDLFPGPKFLFG